jgi:hypothetical protein
MFTRSSILGFLRHWMKALMGPVVTICLLLYQQMTGRRPTWGLFGTIIFAGLAWQFYTEFQNAKAETHSHRYPTVYLRYDQAHDTNFYNSGFFVQAEGEKRAFDVTISSEAVVAQNHKRIAMEWEVPKQPIGNTPVPVQARCVLYQQGLSHSLGGISGRQIHRFFEEKKDFPNELEITLKCKDVDGRICPQRKFRITSNRDYRGNFEIGCIPIGNQAPPHA